MTALGPYRIVDLTTSESWLAGRLLADLGAEVVKVEPPGGDSGRLLGPFAGEDRNPEANLRWWAYNHGKSSVVIDLSTAGGRSELKALVGASHALLESHSVGSLDRLGLGYSELIRHRPDLVLTSITPFGQDGPHSHFQGTDLVLAALGGLAYLTGDVDRPPVRVTEPQSSLHGATEAALATAIGLYHTARTGVGQHIDVAAQLSVVRTLMNATAFPMLEGYELTRQGVASASSYAPFRRVFGCRDGWVYLPTGHRGVMRRLVDAMAAEGEPTGVVAETDWASIDFAQAMRDPARGHSFVASVDSEISGFFAKYSKVQIRRLADQHQLLLSPVNTTADIARDEQLVAHEFFQTIDQGPEIGAVRHAGPWVRMSVTPLRTGVRAPWVGEHQDTIADSTGPQRAKSDVDPADAPGGPSRVFEGLRVWDMSWVGVGPITARYLAEHGATVVHLDSMVRPDILRLSPPFSGGRPDINNSMYFGDFNASKLSIGLDLGQESAREVALQLADWADVVIESFTPGIMARWGLSYEVLSRRNPSLIMLSTSMQGQTGPRSQDAGFGNMASALSGFYQVTGWPDRDPVPIYGAYSDFICPRFNTLALVAAIDHRRRTGEGQHIDGSQYEIALQYLASPLLAYETSGRVAEHAGNSDPDAAPHAIYPCLGDDRWIAIAVETDEQWDALCRAMGDPSWAKSHHFATLESRKNNESELNGRVGDWTKSFDARKLMYLLQPDVPAGVVQSQSELHVDPQISHRGYFVELDHAVMGRVPYNGAQARFSHTEPTLRTPSPCIGEHSYYVLTELLGFDDEAVADLLASEAVVITGG